MAEIMSIEMQLLQNRADNLQIRLRMKCTHRCEETPALHSLPLLDDESTLLFVQNQKVIRSKLKIIAQTCSVQNWCNALAKDFALYNLKKAIILMTRQLYGYGQRSTPFVGIMLGFFGLVQVANR